MQAPHHPPIIWGRFFEIRTLVEWAADHVKQLWGEHWERKHESKRPRIYVVDLPGLNTKGPPPAPTTLDLLAQLDGCDLHDRELDEGDRVPYRMSREDNRKLARKNLRGRGWIDPCRYKVWR
jgi:hypothetical protein